MNTISQKRGRAGSRQTRLHAAFTLIELMMVISIIALLAALIVWGTSAAGDKKVRARANTEMEGIKLAIDGFHKKHGFYPPGNVNPALSGTNQLFYELTGTEYNNTAKSFKVMLGDIVDLPTI
jgi:prepilin-type N-terminal cleavage/methylation domain-containing protein